jgi:hypothetical protein
MRHLMSRVLVLLVLVGFLVFFNAPKSEAVALACSTPCQQACWATYRPCLGPNSPDFFSAAPTITLASKLAVAAQRVIYL